MDRIDRAKGCLVGGAIGDALGYPVELMKEDEIFSKYGESGITEYELDNGIAHFSDDTQMTLFTADGLILSNYDELKSIKTCYLDWMKTQMGGTCETTEGYSRMTEVPELFASREPGRTCMLELLSGGRGTIEMPMNNSKGCCGLTRVAPVGLYRKNGNVNAATLLAAQSAAITHGHELGYMSAAALVAIVRFIAFNEMSIESSVKASESVINNVFKSSEHAKELIDLMELAIELSKEDMDDLEAIHKLGEGWVAEETLAIAIYCSLKYEYDLEKAVIASVNHGGDSDSTGTVTGNIIGASLGFDAIPDKFKENLELIDLICETAEEL